MTCNEAADQLLQILRGKRAAGVADSDLAFTEDSLCVGVARVGHETQKIITCRLREMGDHDMGGPLHSMVLPARKLHPIEIEYLQQFSEKPLQELDK